jgi:hypothetical protein
MTLPLTVATLAHAYDYLCEFPPFDKWNLPPSEEVKFSIIKKADRYAHYQFVNGVHQHRGFDQVCRPPRKSALDAQP